MAGTLTISTLSDGTNSTNSTQIIKGSARAWAAFNGASGSIYGSFNVSSVTRNSTGNYTANYTTAMPNTNYSFVGSCGNNTSVTNIAAYSFALTTTAPTTSATNFITGDSRNGNVQDCTYTNFTVMSF